MTKYARRVTTTAVETTRALALEREALDLAQQGYTVRRIADAQGCSVSTAHDRVRRALDRLAPVAEAEEYRRILGDQLEQQIAVAVVVQRHALEVDDYGRPRDLDAAIKAGAQLVRVADRLAKLRGLDAPVRHDVTLTDKITAEVEALVEELAAAGGYEADDTPLAG